MSTDPPRSSEPDPPDGPHARVRIPEQVYRGIEAVRRSGLTNMLDRPAVADIAEAMGFLASARWVRRHRDLYARAVFHGFEVVGGDGGGA